MLPAKCPKGEDETVSLIHPPLPPTLPPCGPPAGELNYLLVHPVAGSRPLQLRRAELVSLEGRVLQTVPLGPPGKDGVQRGGPLRPPPGQQLFRLKVRSLRSDE